VLLLSQTSSAVVNHGVPDDCVFLCLTGSDVWCVVQVKALLQEMANFEDTEPVNQYQSMYDMVKRRSNKEREKEDHMKEMESRAKSLNKLVSIAASKHNSFVFFKHSVFNAVW